MKKCLHFLLCAALLCALALPISSRADLPLIIDDARLLTAEEEASLEEMARELRQAYGMDVAILTVYSLGGETPESFADDYYDSQGYADDGILFLLSMEYRDWYISTCGDARYVLTDYGVQQSAAEALPFLSAGDYCGGFAVWLAALPDYFDAWLAGDFPDGYAGDSGDSYHSSQEIAAYYDRGSPNLLLSLGVGLLAAAATVLIMRGGMNTKRRQNSAGDYLVSGSFRLRTHQDLFLYSNIRKTPRPKDTGSGGSSAHRSAGSRSHGGRGGKF